MSVTPWVDEYERIAVANTRRLDFLGLLFSHLDRLGIDALPLKGMDLLLRAYPGIGLRPMVDVDLLIEPQNLGHVLQVLKKMGLKQKNQRDVNFAEDSVDFFSKDGRVCLDLSWSLNEMDGFDDIWSRRVVRSTALGERKLLHPEHAFVHALTWSVSHRGSLAPRLAQDLAALLHTDEKEFDWTRLAQDVRRAGLAAPVHYGLCYAKSRGLGGVPHAFYATLSPRSPAERALAGFYRRSVTETPRDAPNYLLVLLRTPTFQASLRQLARTLSPPPLLVNARFEGNGSHHWQLYVQRPLRLLAQSLSLMPAEFRSLWKKRPLGGPSQG